MRNEGFTLLEAMIVTMVLTTVSLALYNINLAMTRAAVHQEHRTTLQDEGRTAMQYMVRRIRMADSGTMETKVDGSTSLTTLGAGETTNVTFQAVADMDGNGVAINADYTMGLTDLMSIGPDYLDANGDGFYEEQLVHLDNSGNVVRVLTNHLADGGGFTLQRTFGGIMINMVLVHQGNGTVSPTVVRMSRLVTARN